MVNKLLPYLKYRYIICFFAFIAGWPCVFYLMGWLPDYKFNYLVILAMLVAFCLLKSALKVHGTILNLIIFQCFVWVFFSIIHNDSSYYTRILLLLIVYFVLAIQHKYQSTLDYIKIYNGWIVLQAIAGTIGVLLILVNVLHPIFTFTEMDGRPGYYFGLLTTNTYTDGFVRNAGFFDEPGALAYWGIMALLLNKVFVGNKRVEGLLIIGLVSTFSMAYYIQIVLYVILFNRKGKFGIAGIVIVLCILFSLMSFFASINESLDTAIFGRFVVDDTSGQLAGDNRTALAKVTLTYFLQNPIFGTGAERLLGVALKDNVFVGANPFSLLAADGIVGYTVSLLPFIYIILKRKRNKNIRFAWYIMLIGFLQRPYDGTQLLYPLTMYMFLQAELLKGKDLYAKIT